MYMYLQKSPRCMRICIYVNVLGFFYSEIKTKESFQNDQGVTRFDQ